MCSRFTLTSHPEAIRQLFRHEGRPNYPPRYNIAPTDPIAVVREREGKREFALLRWGLIPSWVRNPDEFSLLINARAETALEKPSFRAAMKHHRCLAPADGFYEWSGQRGRKRAWHVRLEGGGPMAFAGLWEHWMGPDGSEIETVAILTTNANDVVKPIHNRMPAILPPDAFDAWLDCNGHSAKEAAVLLKPAEEPLEVYEVSTKVNNVRANGEELIEPLD